MQQNNQDYAFLQLAYYDFPIYDSPSAILGMTSITFEFDYEIDYLLPTIIGGITFDEFATESNSFQLTVNLLNICTIDDFLNRLKQQFLLKASSYILGSATADIDYIFLAFLQDIYYDQYTQRIVFKF